MVFRFSTKAMKFQEIILKMILFEQIYEVRQLGKCFYWRVNITHDIIYTLEKAT